VKKATGKRMRTVTLYGYYYRCPVSRRQQLIVSTKRSIIARLNHMERFSTLFSIPAKVPAAPRKQKT
jgi:hypothetical protein